MALVNVLSSKLSERFQMLASVGKITALSVIIIMGMRRMIAGNVEVIDEGMKHSKWSATELAFALYNGLWAYGGWSNVNHVTSGIKKPPRNVPRVVKTILPLVLVVYLMVVLSYFTAMTREELLASRAIGVTWAERVLGPASSIISIGVGLTALGSINATFLSAGRLSGVAAKNGQMPDVTSWVHVRSKTPLVTVALRCLIATIVIFLATGQELLRFYIFTVWLFHGTSIVALLVLRFKNKHKKRPYKVDLWIPVLVVMVIAFMLLAPFFESPKPEFISALVLIVLSLVCYYPITWLKEKSVISVPDKVTIWLQLFLRIAPKRDLRRERRSMMRRMSMLARDSILITPNVQTPNMMRRFSRRMSRLSWYDGSPALIRRMGEEPQLRRRVNRGSSLAEADIKRGRSNSMWAFSENKPSPAIIRKKPQRGSHSFNHADISTFPSPSLPILKNRLNTTPAASKEAEPGALAPPHQSLRTIPSPIPEEINRTQTVPDFDGEEAESHDPKLEVVADFESDGGGEYEVLAHPDDCRRMSYSPEVMLSDNSNSDTSSSDSDSSKSDKSNILKHSIFASLFASSSNSSSDSDSSMDEDGSVEDLRQEQAMSGFYYSASELDSDHSNENSRGEDNPGFVLSFDPEEQQLELEQEQDRQPMDTAA